MEFWGFLDICWFPSNPQVFLAFKSSGNSWDNSFIPCLLLIIALCLTCGESLVKHQKVSKYYEYDRSLFYNTSARHEQYECDTSATRVSYEQHERGMSVTRTKLVQHKWKIFVLIKARVKAYFHPYISYMANERFQRDEQFYSKNYLLEMPRSHAKLRLKSAPQKLKLVMAKAISKGYTLDCSCKCPDTFPQIYA